ncbi:Sec-independent protein translocase protein TatC [Novipirellula aureliae]|uniref:Sec-independent protein translocase protein TatC n=1 Tax=Novipirellula aureliae TaxID=2527966 RepID=A0A5C6DZ62_9BACT|nr:Sec-independent protein translocase protein TatC [Novipirellula aureliae]
MTFGEHLEELRSSLVKAILWLAIGMAVGLLFANRVVRYIQHPLQEAIQKFNAERDLTSLGYTDLDAPEIQPLRQFLMNSALIWELVYEIPDELQTLDPDALIPATPDDEDANADSPVIVVQPHQMKDLISRLPDPSDLKPKIQLRQNKASASTLKVEESFMIWVKAGLIVGAVLASPMILYHLWSFVAAGLHSHERRYFYMYLPISVLLFSSGVILAFFLVLNYVLSFLLKFNGSMDVAVEPRLTYYVNFVLMLPLGFGIAFQLPLVMLFLQRIGLFETEAYIGSWRVATVVIFVVSMIATPADVTSMVALAVPLMFLYFLGILMCKFIPRGRGLGNDAYDPV